jgi:hypothetical protein
MHQALLEFQPADRRALQRVIDQQGLIIHTILRHGPRFIVAVVEYQGKTALWKMCVRTAKDDRWSMKKFFREITFLSYFQGRSSPTATTFAPRIYASSTGIRPWYIRELIHGHDYALSGNIRFRESFFTEKNLRAILRGFHELQSIPTSHLPKKLQRQLHRYDTVEQWFGFLAPFWEKINELLHDQHASQDLIAWLKNRQAVFDSLPTALAHHEPYAPHFLRYNNHLRLIDWENINIASPVTDATILWMRASRHPKWQAALHRRWKAKWKRLGKDFDTAWETDLVVRSIYTMLSSKTYEDQADIRELARVAKSVLKKTLSTYRSKK